LEDVVIIDINTYIKKESIEIRKQHKLKLPDAIIAATARYLDLPVFSADSDFKKVPDLNFLKYEL
jgi:predicted nucleic acid-binding protein